MNEVVEAIVGAPLRVEELKHKPGRRRTVRVRGARRTAIVKVYASDRALVVARRIDSLRSGPDEPVVPSVLHVDPARRLVALSDVPGRPLREPLLEGDVLTCARAGRALGRWHAAWQGATPDALRPHTAEREVSILRARAAAASPLLASAVADLLPQLDLDWPCSTVVHRDLYEEQILVDARIGLIDCDDAALGPPELDVGNLLAHMELLELRRGRDLSAARRALREAYEDEGPALDDALLERCRRLTLLRLACLNDDLGLVEVAHREGAPT